MTEPEWGPWIEHDGKGCPVMNGVIVHTVWNDRYEVIGSVSANGRSDVENPWIWINNYPNIIRYRIRKPRAMKLLQSIVENPPKQRIKEDA